MTPEELDKWQQRLEGIARRRKLRLSPDSGMCGTGAIRAAMDEAKELDEALNVLLSERSRERSRVDGLEARRSHISLVDYLLLVLAELKVLEVRRAELELSPPSRAVGLFPPGRSERWDVPEDAS